MSEDFGDKWWIWLLAGIGLLGFAGYMFWDLTQFESTGGTRLEHQVIAGLYELGGKWLVSGFLGLVGVILLLVAFKSKSEE